MKVTTLVFFLFSCPLILVAQTKSFSKIIHKDFSNTGFSDTLVLPDDKGFGQTRSFSFSFVSTITLEDDPVVFVRTNQRHIHLVPSCESNTIDFDYVSGLFILEEGESGPLMIDVQNLPESATEVQLIYHVTETSQPAFPGKKIVPSSRQDCPCPLPSFIPRSEWGAAYQLTNDIYRPPATITNVTHLIVHHSATGNASNNWPGVVASIFNYHVNTNQWQDIGYNWLIDPEGNLYQGRGGGEDVRGAHMCGYNDNTMAVCLLGTFTNTDPDPRALTMLDSLFAYKSCQKNFDPRDRAEIVSYTGNMFRISGHRDGCAPNYTECPGNRLYAFLPTIREATYDFITDNCSTTAINPATNSREKKYKLDVLNGQIQVESEERGFLQICDLAGIVCHDQNVEKGINAIRFNSPTGIYLFKIRLANGTFTEKVFYPGF